MNATAFAGVSPTILGLHRAADIVAALTPPAPGAAGTAVAPSAPKESIATKVAHFAPGVVGAGVGFFVGKKHKHPVLGALAGHALVQSGWDAYKGDKKRAACELAVEGAGVLGALYHKKIPGLKKHAVLGYVGGILAGAVATYFVPGSPVKQAVARFRSK